MPLGLLVVNRNMIAVNSSETFIQNQADLTLRFDTGLVEHAAVGGI